VKEHTDVSFILLLVKWLFVDEITVLLKAFFG